jgi:hypothetical protein
MNDADRPEAGVLEVAAVRVEGLRPLHQAQCRALLGVLAGHAAGAVSEIGNQQVPHGVDTGVELAVGDDVADLGVDPRRGCGRRIAPAPNRRTTPRIPLPRRSR